MQRYRPSRSDRQKSLVRKAIGFLVLLGFVAAGIGYFYFDAQSKIRPIDQATFCPTDAKGPNSVTDVLIDLTDKFTPTQQGAIRDRLNEIRDNSVKYDLMEIYTVEPTKAQLLKPEFSMCNPGRGEDTSKWSGNPQLVEQHWKSLFANPLQKLFDGILVGGEAEISPIMESIQSIVVTRLGSAGLEERKTPRKLIIISDLLQYTTDYSQYKPVPPFAKFRSTPYYEKIRSDMSGISVEFWYVRREKTLHLQGEKHVDFWRDYIADQGGSVDKVWYVPGT